MKTEKERLLRALTLINDIEDCIVDNKWKKYLQDHLIVVEYEPVSYTHLTLPTRNCG